MMATRASPIAERTAAASTMTSGRGCVVSLPRVGDGTAVVTGPPAAFHAANPPSRIDVFSPRPR